MNGRNDYEKGNITLLGNQHTQYASDYTPCILETFPNKHPGRDYLLSLTALSLPVFAQLQGSQILQRYIFPMSQENLWLRVNH